MFIHCCQAGRFGPSVVGFLRQTALLALLTAAGLGLPACSGGGGSTSSAPTFPVLPPTATGNADITLLFMGNSHTDFHDVPGMVAALVRSVRPGRTVAADRAPGYLFLEERLSDPATLAKLNGQRWSAVVLQAQKYSSSGQFSYSTAEAEELVRMTRRLGSQPVMFPEWPRRGVTETQRIYDLHVSIARVAPACVAPVGQAWDVAAARAPDVVLHDGDGNHAVPAGAFLAAVVLAATLTGASPTDFAAIPLAAVDAATQQRLRAAAAEAVAATPARSHCPGDPVLP
ncbi:MAG: hypothetical protein JNM76_07220 [Betaproteobacteria bacterium]|nr:hypothetical protein [Betaproteobacteria bacterium]